MYRTVSTTSEILATEHRYDFSRIFRKNHNHQEVHHDSCNEGMLL